MNAILTTFVLVPPLLLGDDAAFFFEQAAPTTAKQAIATTTRTVRFDANKHCLPSSTRPSFQRVVYHKRRRHASPSASERFHPSHG
jgi:hypothetical protein